MTRGKRGSSAMVLALVLLLSAACGVQSRSTQSRGLPAGAQVGNTGAPKTLTLAILREPEGFIDFEQGGKRGGAHNAKDIAHQQLVVVGEDGTYQPQLATEIISVDKGSWRVNADGTMDTAWKVRSNVRWHDGTPFTSADLLFTFTVKKDRDISWSSLGRPDLMESATGPDPLTFVIHWSDTYFDADRAQDLPPLPRHLLEDTYRNDKAGFVNSPRFSTEFVGLGPYRLQRWEPGSHIQFARFDDYYQGRPPFDSVVLKFRADPNIMIANILSGTVDVLLPLGVDTEAALEVRRRWEGTGNQTRFSAQDTIWYVQIQFRPDYARPSNGLTNRAVRQALYHAIDRQALVEAVSEGVAPIADSWFRPDEPIHAELESSIPRFPYDPTRARALLAQAGWTPSADGTLVSGASGERFEIEVRGNQAGGIEKRVSVVGDGWKTVGVQPQFNIVPAARQGDAEYAATFPAGFVFFSQGRLFWQNRLHSSSVASPANRWSGRNRGGYSNPKVDALLDQIVVAIDPRERIPLHRQLLAEQLGDVALMPLYWEVTPLLMVKGVTGQIGGQDEVITNFFTWNRD